MPPHLHLRRKLKDEFVCSEKELESRFHNFFREIKPGDWIFLEGPLGAGKSTWARGLVRFLGAQSQFQGSPTFALAHEYETAHSQLIHIDFYRLKSEAEIFDSGIESYFYERPKAVILTEWISQFDDFKNSLSKSGHRIFEIDIAHESEGTRRFKLWQST